MTSLLKKIVNTKSNWYVSGRDPIYYDKICL